MCFSIGVADKRTFCLWISSNLFGQKHQSLNPMQELWSSKSWASFQNDVEDCCMIIVTNTVRSVKRNIFHGKYLGYLGCQDPMEMLLQKPARIEHRLKQSCTMMNYWEVNLLRQLCLCHIHLHLFCRRHFQVFLYSLVKSIEDNDFWLVQPFQSGSICFYSAFGTISCMQVQLMVTVAASPLL